MDKIMLPTKVFQLDYQDVSQAIWTHLDYIIDYEKRNQIKFDSILAKLRNGTIPGSILANHFQIPMGVIEMPRNVSAEKFNVFFSTEIDKKLTNGEMVSILFVDGICGTGQTLIDVNNFINQHPYSKQIKLTTYCTFTDSKAKKKPDIIGLEVQDKFIQPPWEWRSFTPQAHLDRLEVGNIKASKETEFCIGFSSQFVFKLVEEHFNQNIEFDWTMVFSESDRKLSTASGVSSFEQVPAKITLEQGRNKYKKLIEEKVNFIEHNGLTHFIEDDVSQALLISQACPVCHIIYIEENHLFRVFSKSVNREDFNFPY
jgi:hypoxanthine phosphoribosyltransferase